MLFRRTLKMREAAAVPAAERCGVSRPCPALRYSSAASGTAALGRAVPSLQLQPSLLCSKKRISPPTERSGRQLLLPRRVRPRLSGSVRPSAPLASRAAAGWFGGGRGVPAVGSPGLPAPPSPPGNGLPRSPQPAPGRRGGLAVAPLPARWHQATARGVLGRGADPCGGAFSFVAAAGEPGSASSATRRCAAAGTGAALVSAVPRLPLGCAGPRRAALRCCSGAKGCSCPSCRAETLRPLEGVLEPQLLRDEKANR